MDRLVVQDIVKHIGSVRVLSNITLSVNCGEVVGFVGPNGAGKSTTMKVIAGLLKQDSGSVSIGEWRLEKNRTEVLGRISAMIDAPPTYPTLSASEHLLFLARLRGVPTPEPRVKSVLNRVGLSFTSRKSASRFSTGMKQRLALAMALIQEPAFLLLDEPTNGLDPLAVKDFRSLIKELATDQNIGVLISSHLLSEIQRMCARVVFIQGGRIVRETDTIFGNEGKTRLRVRTTNDNAALALLSGFTNVEMVDNGQSLIVSVQDDQVSQIAAKLVTAGLGLLELTPVQRNLEEEYAVQYGGTEQGIQ